MKNIYHPTPPTPVSKVKDHLDKVGVVYNTVMVQIFWQVAAGIGESEDHSGEIESASHQDRGRIEHLTTSKPWPHD